MFSFLYMPTRDSLFRPLTLFCIAAVCAIQSWVNVRNRGLSMEWTTTMMGEKKRDTNLALIIFLSDIP